MAISQLLLEPPKIPVEGYKIPRGSLNEFQLPTHYDLAIQKFWLSEHNQNNYSTITDRIILFINTLEFVKDDKHQVCKILNYLHERKMFQFLSETFKIIPLGTENINPIIHHQSLTNLLTDKQFDQIFGKISLQEFSLVFRLRDKLFTYSDQLIEKYGLDKY